MDSDSMFFNDYCIVCDRAIAPPKEEAVLVVKKKVAAGAIRIRNPDGTVTTRTANGQKTTRPPLRRGPNSANRLAAVAAAHNTTFPKPQPLTRSKTAEGSTTSAPPIERTQSSSPDSLPKTPACPCVDPIPFHSQIYCSRACAQVEADRSSDLARKMSVESGLHLVTSGLPISGYGSRKSPYGGPPSPLFMSGSSNSSDPPQQADHAATSAPNFFHMHRDTEEAWRDINRQRRSSVHPSFRPGQAHRTHSTSSFSAVDQSSDSLNSLWVQQMDQESNLGRSTSGSGRIRMTPVSEHMQSPQRGWPTAANTSIATSLSTNSSAMPIPAEFGSAPEHTLNLWHSYHNSFSQRDATGTSASRGLLGTTPTPPSQHAALPARRGSSTQGAALQRPVGGTIRAKSRTDVTWDSFGLDEVNAHKKRHEKTSGVVEGSARTPKQSIQIGERGCVIRSHSPPPNTRRDSSTSQHPGALAIPHIKRGGSSISSGRTPTNMPPPPSSTPSNRAYPSSPAIPDLASLRLGVGASGCSPYLSSDHAVSTSQSSAPRSTWNWSKWESEGGRTYAVPEALTKGSSGVGKAGLFFFK